MIVVHRAGEYDRGLQVCSDCGEVLCDHRESVTPAGDDDLMLGWAEGAFIRCEPGIQAVVREDAGRRCTEALQ